MTTSSRPGAGGSGARASGGRSVVALVARGELLRLLRDRKAVFFALVLPLLLYPLLFLGSEKLGQASERRMEDQSVAIAANLEALDGDLRQQLLDRLPAPDGATFSIADELLEGLTDGAAPEAGAVGEDASNAGGDDHSGEDAQRERASELLEELAVDLLLVARPSDSEGSPPVIVAWFRRNDESGMRASQLIGSAVSDLSTTLFEARLVELLGVDPAQSFAATSEDVASVADSAGLALGKLLPLIAVLVVLSGGAFAALEAFAAEREVGTLETLLVQPVERIDIARGKLIAVLATGLAAWIGNAASLIACAAGGLLATIDEGLADAPVAVLIGRVGLGTVIMLPTIALIASVLGMVSARARSYREGQNYILPLTLAGMALASPAAAADVVFDPLLALIPVLGPSLAMRDALAGSLAPVPALVALASSAVYALLALRGIANTLDAERLLQGADVDAEAGARRAHARRAILWGGVGVGAVLLIGSWLQSKDLVWGLVATLWGLALGIALLAARDLGKKLDLRPAAVLGLTGGSPVGVGLGVCGALLAGPGLGQMAGKVLELQERVLPMPTVDAGAMEQVFAALLDRPLIVALFLVAISPAICEELLFRGAVLTGLRRDLSVGKTLGWQALLFALAHGSVHRLVPTASLGLILGLLRLRTGSILPCIALHASYNGVLVAATQMDPEGRAASLLQHPAWMLATIAGLALALLPRQAAVESTTPTTPTKPNAVPTADRQP
ncbi:type II CAAX prenyl endopeptidase Rce1 family protein [Engelhardtia mirabilis]|uniref:ABC-2 family transporter protein n=1 Tax=Engelhardtia mirabilis TaxID=2528011 RepID=A0A518BKV7_9BACT|nr:ABC-2 family transporter protein [Planctomycetes bacterium Pla133]QDV01936.1 ABC-2 family transporter protein [Planctomycetes bacterium Pla86]